MEVREEIFVTLRGAVVLHEINIPRTVSDIFYLRYRVSRYNPIVHFGCKKSLETLP